MSAKPKIRFLSEDYTDTIQLMMEYIRLKKIDSSYDNGIKKLIQECEDCRILFEDIKIFLSEEDAMVYELLNEDKVKKITTSMESQCSKFDNLQPIYTTLLTKDDDNEWYTHSSECMCDTEY